MCATVLTVEGSIASRNARGGTAGDRVAEQLDALRAWPRPQIRQFTGGTA